MARAAGIDPVADHIGKHFVFELRRIWAAFAHQITVEPLLGDAMELAEEMKLGENRRIWRWFSEQASSQTSVQQQRDLGFTASRNAQIWDAR